MSRAKGMQLIDALSAASTVVTWNGAGYDFKKLYELTGDDRCKTLAVRHADIESARNPSNPYAGIVGLEAITTLD